MLDTADSREEEKTLSTLKLSKLAPYTRTHHSVNTQMGSYDATLARWEKQAIWTALSIPYQ